MKLHLLTFDNLEKIIAKVWIGLSRSGEGFEWTDESPFDFENWYEGEPNDGYESEDCVDVSFCWHNSGFRKTCFFL